MIVFPKAKINLGLRITGRRGDGYHDIETLFYPVRIFDALEFVASPSGTGKDTLNVTGIPVGIRPEDNIVMRAVARLRKQCELPWLIMHLHKAIPHGAGLGGGSSDAACLLKALVRHYSLDIPEEELHAMALEIGSDCPFFLNGVPAYATGRGEKLKEVEPFLSGYYLVLTNPGVSINTAEAYSHATPGIMAGTLLSFTGQDISEWKYQIKNDFEEYAFQKYPVIRKIKEDLYAAGALFSLMSGSGSSVFGIFKDVAPDLPGNIREMILWQGVM